MSAIPHALRLTMVSSPIGDLTFTPTVDGTVTGYEARAYAEGTTTPVLATKWLGKPNADPVSNLIRVNIATMLNALPPANYDVIVAAFLSGGPSESAHATAYAVPLQAP